MKLRESFKADETNEYVVPLFKKSLLFADQLAIKDSTGEYTYLQLYMSAKKLSTQLSNICGSASSTHVAYLCPNNILWPMTQWACWMSGQVAIPLNCSYSFQTLKNLTEDANVKLLISTPEYESTAEQLATHLDVALVIIDHTFLPSEDLLDFSMQRILLTTNNQVMIEGTLNNNFYTNSTALILYTSGTTGKPKGTILTYKNLDAQIRGLLEIWQYNASDTLLHVLPLNHIHGCVNSLMCPLSVGAKIIMHECFNSHTVWSTILGINASAKERVNVFMAYPTMYSLLIAEYSKIFEQNTRMIEYIENYCKRNFRLMVTVSAILPINVFNRWREITGHRLLQCYGMPETGMMLSNPYIEDRERQRRPDTVGNPLPEVTVRLVSPDDKVLLTYKGESNKGFWAVSSSIPLSKISENVCPQNSEVMPTVVGELQVSGPNIFKAYLNHPEFSETELVDYFFKTGDIASYEAGVFKILCRSCVDVLKVGEQVVYSTQIESLLFKHPSIKDVAVLGIPDEICGERMCVICVLNSNTKFNLEALNLVCSKLQLSFEKPPMLKIVNELPRDNVSKINKRELIKMCLNDEYIK